MKLFRWSYLRKLFCRPKLYGRLIGNDAATLRGSHLFTQDCFGRNYRLDRSDRPSKLKILIKIKIFHELKALIHKKWIIFATQSTSLVFYASREVLTLDQIFSQRQQWTSWKQKIRAFARYRNPFYCEPNQESPNANFQTNIAVIWHSYSVRLIISHKKKTWKTRCRLLYSRNKCWRTSKN